MTSGYATENSSKTLTRLLSSRTSPHTTGHSTRPSLKPPCSVPSSTRRSSQYVILTIQMPAFPYSTATLRPSSTPMGFPWDQLLPRPQIHVSHMTREEIVHRIFLSLTVVSMVHVPPTMGYGIRWGVVSHPL